MAAKNESAVIAKLRANKEAKSGSYDVTLEESGVVATIPKFINHGLWMKAQRVAKNDPPKAQAAFVCEVVRFDGEKITLTDLTELLPAGDMLVVIGKVFGDDDEEDAEGKDETEAA